MESRAQMEPLTPSGFGWKLSRWEPGRGAQALSASGGLLVIRAQPDLAPEELLELASEFGRLERNEKYDPDFLLPGFPEILRIGNLREDGKRRSLFIEADPPPLMWHSDDSFRIPQPVGSCLLCVETPAHGGETGFAGMIAAYRALAPEMQQRLEGLTAVHSYNHLNETLRKTNPHRPPLTDELKRLHPPVRRPIAAPHPLTGEKALFVPQCHIESIDGLSGDEARTLLAELLAHATRPEFTYMHRWKPGDVVVWDNRAALHAPTPFDASRSRRMLYRLTMLAD